jgi:hypothetical protein
MIIPIPTEPYYICVFEPFSENKNKELLTSYQCILVCHYVTFYTLIVDKIIYTSPTCTYTPPTYFYAKYSVHYSDQSICGAIEASKIMEEPYLCMETVTHLFSPNLPGFPEPDPECVEQTPHPDSHSSEPGQLNPSPPPDSPDRIQERRCRPDFAG